MVSLVHISDIDSGLTTIGHTFCRRCIRRWAVEQRMKKCPSCRLNLHWEGKQCCRFKTIQRGLVCG
ncbi:MAG: hypothetical protein CL912_19405 [Deltaproteobacteria bacterium]|nr:hypothetical protein [Deltaproteobacteria bacterium]